MTSLYLLPLLTFAGVLLAVLLVEPRLVANRTPVHRRLAQHAAAVVETGRPIERINVLRESGYRSGSVAERLLRRFPPTATAERELGYANISFGVLRYLLLRMLAGATVGLLLQLLTDNLVLAGAGAVLGVMLPRLVIKRTARQRRTAFEAQLAEAIDLMVGALKAGHGFMQAIETSAGELKDPMKIEMQRMIDQVNVGGNIIVALDGLTKRIDSPDLKLMAAAIAVQRQAGGNLAEVLQNLANTVRERRRIRGEVKALTASASLSGLIVGLLPFGLAVYMIAISTDYREKMLGTVIGHIMLGFSAVWTLIGYFLSQKISKVEY
ncbi:MAG: type II secretion system F family protein [Chloroflexia bacterium]|nr:type II secretion system F family protein [Chloroflexia bacterium]